MTALPQNVAFYLVFSKERFWRVVPAMKPQARLYIKNMWNINMTVLNKYIDMNGRRVLRLFAHLCEEALPIHPVRNEAQGKLLRAQATTAS